MNIKSAGLGQTEQIVYILNEVTLDLHRKGIKQWTYPWTIRDIEKDVHNNDVYVLWDGHRAIGTFTISVIDHICGMAVEQNSKYLSRIAVLPDYQGKNAGSKIMEFARSSVDGTPFSLYLDCWAGNANLKQFYSAHGMLYVGDYKEADYFVSIFKYNHGVGTL
ncbi:GNAT family N-acetyltransferase [Paenibacillus sp. DMB20]|uniref:GNAT family N-acetyltransferase n=1 Tax=Paenibacillus sp. DMB20 TaxID=1642570 RepID=UPI00069AAFC6|nr:GNAT family N-acetyltransferase [Paenibacillus sp. DMB20]